MMKFLKNNLLILLCITFLSCAEKLKERDPSTSLSQPSLFGIVNNLTEQVIRPGFDDLDKKAQGFYINLKNSCALKNKNYQNEVTKKSFLELLRSFHFTEGFQIGSIAENGYERLLNLYSWPDSSTYGVNENVAKKYFESDYYYDERSAVIGLDAIEYLLFDESFYSDCDGCGDESHEKWGELSVLEKKTSRCDYLTFLTKKVVKITADLKQSWEAPAGEVTKILNYRENFGTLKEFAVKLTHRLAWFDQKVKDRKLGVPSGINQVDCSEESCPYLSEHIYSGDSLNSLLYSSYGFLSLIQGKQTILNKTKVIELKNHSLGYHAYFESTGQERVAVEISEALISVASNLKKLIAEGHTVESLSENIVQNRCSEATRKNRTVEICALYMDFKLITDIYKSKFLAAADFGRPVDSSGDTD